MRPHKAGIRFLVAAVAVVLCVSACSRVAFMKTNPSRKGYDPVTEPVVVHDSDASRGRETARNSVMESQQKLADGDLAGAEKAAKQAAKADPKSADAYTMLGAVADRLGHAADAGANYERAATLEPTGARLNNYGAWLCSNGRAGDSLAWFDKALQDPSYGSAASAMANAGKCALDAGQHVRADQSLRAALQLDPASAVALGALARMQFDAGRYMEARAFSERRLSAAPATADALQLASQIEDKLGDSAAAARYGRRLREEFPGAAQGNAGGSKAP